MNKLLTIIAASIVVIAASIYIGQFITNIPTAAERRAAADAEFQRVIANGERSARDLRRAYGLPN